MSLGHKIERNVEHFLMIQEQLIGKFEQATWRAFPNAYHSALHIEVSPTTHEKFGHYQCNVALKLAKPLNMPARAVAEAIAAQLELSHDGQKVIDKIEIAGPGFINITLDGSYMASALERMAKDPRLGIALTKHPKKVIIDFSSPNTAKEMHVGHLRSTIIGACLSNLFEFLGHNVLRLNHIGDWGTSFGMLIAYMQEDAKDVLEGHAHTDLAQLASWYKGAKQRFDSDAEFKKRAQEQVVALQSGNPHSLKAWEIICQISRQAYQEIYDLLEVSLIERGESFYNAMLPDAVADLEAKQLVTVSDGAKCIFVAGFQNREGQPFPYMVQKSDGGYNYDTTDIAAIRHRLQVEKGERLIYVTDAGQAVHFQLLFKVAEMALYLDKSKSQVDHVSFGLVLGADGKKFRSRSGQTEKLIDLLNTAIERADQILAERTPDMAMPERQHLARTLGIGAVKYADLSCHRTSDYVFSYDKMLRFEGNTAAYLLYCYVRVAGIKRKVGIDIDVLLKTASLTLSHPSEITLGLHLLQFAAVLAQMERDLLPNQLTEYLFNLAEKFNAFFRDCRVEGTAEQNSRLLICEAVARTMQRGLAILGLRTVERM